MVPLEGYMNIQNSRIWSAENPCALLGDPLHSSEIGVWSDIFWKLVVGLLFFEETITVKNYSVLLSELCWKRINGTAVSARWGDCSYCENNGHFLAGLIW